MARRPESKLSGQSSTAPQSLVRAVLWLSAASSRVHVGNIDRTVKASGPKKWTCRAVNRSAGVAVLSVPLVDRCCASETLLQEAGGRASRSAGLGICTANGMHDLGSIGIASIGVPLHDHDALSSKNR